MNILSKSAVAILLFSMGGSAYGQHAHDWRCSNVKRNAKSERNAAKTTVASPEEDKYDVKYVKLNVDMTNISTTITADAITNATVVAPSMSAYVFELVPPLVIDSVLIDGANTSFTSAGDVHTVAFGSPKTMGTLFSAHVYYHGTPTSGSSFTTYGISTLRSPSWNRWVTFTLSEPYTAKNWWPCKQSLRDKIDSTDVWITVDDSLMAGSNGTLAAVTPVTAGRNRYEWKERYPIDYYLISLSAARYIDHSYYMHFSGSADTMLIQNYIYDNPGTLTSFQDVIDSTGYLVDYFSTIYGRYPFWKEKYGHCMAPISGGMEHQTMTTLGFFESWLVAHELGHQWFGDNVTCGSWADVVMNEGFASYSEYLYLDHFRTHAAAVADMRDRQDNVMSELGGTVFVDDTSGDARIFDSRLSYDKGACVIHTLRQVIDNDTYFFDVLRAWQTTMKDSTGTIDEFKNLTKTLLGSVVNGINIDTFFKQWFYGEGFPAYAVRWNKSGNDVYVQLSQGTSVPASVGLFKVPLDIRLRSPLGDTIIRVINDQHMHEFHFTWAKPMSSLTLDPNDWLTDSITSIVKDITLGVPGFFNANVKIYPNPATENWEVSGVPGETLAILTDISGKVLWRSESTAAGTLKVPAQQFATGLYILKISKTGYSEKAFKLLRQ
jgi:aminopeptidase N